MVVVNNEPLIYNMKAPLDLFKVKERWTQVFKVPNPVYKLTPVQIKKSI